MESTTTVIFMGMQGSGKGTQARLLADYVRNTFSETSLLHFEAGKEFRSFASEQGYSQEKVKQSLEEGNIQPVFLATYFWSHKFINHLEKNTAIILDGSPRRLLEAKLLTSAMEFYDRSPSVINLEIDDAVAIERLLGRGREDDSKEGIRKRLAWFKSEVLPTISYLRDQDRYQVIDVDGTQTIEAVHQDIVTKLNFEPAA